MTVSTNTPVSGPYLTDGVNKSWQFEFRIQAATQMTVVTRNVDGSDEQTFTSGFTIDPSYLDKDTGGFVVYPAVGAALATGRVVFAVRAVEYAQPTRIGNEGSFYPQTHEDTFDLVVMQIQQLAEQAGRTLTAPVGEDASAVVAELLAAVDDASGFADASQASAVASAALAAASASSSSDASDSADLANRFANENEDVPVLPGLFSAKHFMLKCAAILAVISNTMAGWIHAAAGKTTLNDDDEIGIADSAAAWVLKKISLFNLVRYIASITGQVKISGCETLYVSTTTIQMKTGYVFFNGRRTTFGAALTKALNATFVAGAAGGMLDIGAMAASKTYFIHAVRNVATGAGDWVASLQSDPALVNMTNLTGWTVEGRVNIVLTTSGNVIRQYTQDGNEYRAGANVTEISATAWAAADFFLVQIPVGISTEAYLLLVNNQSANSSGVVQAWTDLNAGPALALLSNNVGATPLESRITAKLRTRSTGAIRSSAITGIGSASYTVQTFGFNDYTAPRPNGA